MAEDPLSSLLGDGKSSSGPTAKGLFDEDATIFGKDSAESAGLKSVAAEKFANKASVLKQKEKVERQAAAANLYHHATHSATNSISGAGNGLGSLELGLSLGVNVGTFSYQNRTGTQHDHVLSNLRAGAGEATSDSMAAHIRTTGASPR